MKENKGTMESVTLGRVPDSERKNWWTVALIQAGIMISIPRIMVGSTLASGMGLGICDHCYCSWICDCCILYDVNWNAKQ